MKQRIMIFQFRGKNIEIIEEYKYLGVIMTLNNSFRMCKEQLFQQGRTTMYGLIAKWCKFNLPVDVKLELFDGMVLPIIMNGCEVWGHKPLKYMENLHITFLKHILNVRKTTWNVIIYGELAKYLISIHIKSRMMNYWSRVITGRQNQLSYVMYQCLYKLYNVNCFKLPWLKF